MRGPCPHGRVGQAGGPGRVRLDIPRLVHGRRGVGPRRRAGDPAGSHPDPAVQHGGRGPGHGRGQRGGRVQAGDRRGSRDSHPGPQHGSGDNRGLSERVVAGAVRAVACPGDGDLRHVPGHVAAGGDPGGDPGGLMDAAELAGQDRVDRGGQAGSSSTTRRRSAAS